MAYLLTYSCTCWNSEWVFNVSCFFRKYWMEICFLYTGNFNDSKFDLHVDDSRKIYGYKKNWDTN